MNPEIFTKICRNVFSNYVGSDYETKVNSMTDKEFDDWYTDLFNVYFDESLNEADLSKIRNIVFNDSLKAFPIIESRLAKINQDRIDKEESDTYNVEVDEEHFRAIAKCDVLWLGWECDPTAWVVVKDGKNELVSTDHGFTHFYSKEFLEERVAYYKKVIIESEKLLGLLEQD